jgi:hypothetical protein
MRLTHTNSGGRAVVRGKIWRADGDTEEPAGTDWDYSAAAQGSEGLAGFVSSPNLLGGEVDVDWVLIKAADLPGAFVEAPAPFQPALSLVRDEAGWMVVWPAELQSYRLLTKLQLEDEFWDQVFDGIEITPTEYRYRLNTAEPTGFFVLYWDGF